MKSNQSAAVGMIVVGVCCWALGHLSPIKVSVAKDGLAEFPAELRPCDLAVVDLGLLFKKDVKFNEQMEAMRRGVEDAEEVATTMREALEVRKNKLPELVVGSDEYKKAKSLISIETSQLTAYEKEKKQEFMSRESLNYHECHQRIMKLIERHCEVYGTRCVLRFTREAIDANDPQSILKNINRSILYEKNIDITDAIIESLKADN